jgi:hypothetical protein
LMLVIAFSSITFSTTQECSLMEKFAIT